jgi:hypothetical protein
LLYVVLRRSEAAIAFPLQTCFRNLVTFKSAVKRSPLNRASVQNLVHHVMKAIPNTLLALVPTIAASIRSDSEQEAIMSVEVLAHLYTAGASRKLDASPAILQHLIAASKCLRMAVRLKVVNACSELIKSGCDPNDEEGIKECLSDRVLDPEATVRAAAIKGLGALCTARGAGYGWNILSVIAARLRDSVFEVRDVVRAPAASSSYWPRESSAFVRFINIIRWLWSSPSIYPSLPRL